MNRKSGVLMHISSLWGDYSTGSFGKEALEFIDFLAEAGISVWQVLPFCMPDDCNSPYKSPSAFGGNPYFIDLPALFEKGYLTAEELKEAKQKTPYLCEYDRLSRERLPLLRKASERAKADTEEVCAIRELLSQFPALSSASRFLALREENEGLPWQEWSRTEPCEDSLFFWQFIQYEFFTQWQTIKQYANKKGVSVIGDVPIYVSTDSADVWENPSLFLLDKNNRPTCGAGVPPDYFAKDGQLWNNPLYDWKAMKQDGYAWWCHRLSYMLTLFDGVRIDHFRGFESFWSVPAGAVSAKEGKWVKGPGRALIDALKRTADGRLIIAEDLGDITPAVESLLRYSGFPGMRVVQFGFLGDDASPHVPYRYPRNCVAYSGTHDNNTLLGYIWEADESSRRRIFEYCGYHGTDWNDGCRAILRTLLASSADTVIFPIQDLLVYGADTRMNTPGNPDGNWQYRVTKNQLLSLDASRLAHWNRLYGRA